MTQCYYRDELIEDCSRYSSSLVEQEHDIWDKYDHRNHEQRKGELMGSGESDVYSVTIGTTNNTGDYWKPSSTYKLDNSYTNLSYWYPNTIYMYQIRCPKRGCKKMNWAQLDVITPCRNCGARLKAVSDQPDFIVPVDKG